MCASPTPATCRWRWPRRPRSRSAARRCCAGRIAPESVDLISPRLSLFYSEDGTLSLKFAHARRGARERARASAGPARLLDADAGCLRRRSRGRRGAGAHRSRQGAVGGLRARAAARARQRLPARGRAQVRHRRHRQRQPQEHLAGAGARHRSRPPPQPQLDRRAAPRSNSLAGPWTLNFRTYEIENAKTLQLAVSVQGLVPRGLARTLPQLAGAGELRRAGMGRGASSTSPAPARS